MRGFSIASDHQPRPNYGLTEVELQARKLLLVDSNGKPMPWCYQCECWHHETADHIEKRRAT